MKTLRREWEIATIDLRRDSGVTDRAAFNRAIDELQAAMLVVPNAVVYRPFTYIWTLAVGRFPDGLRRRVARPTAVREIARAFLAGAGQTLPGELSRVTGLYRARSRPRQPRAGRGRLCDNAGARCLSNRSDLIFFASYSAVFEKYIRRDATSSVEIQDLTPLPQPVLDSGRALAELGHVVGDAHRLDGARVRGDQQVMRADRCALSFERHSYRGVDALDVGLERPDRQRAEDGLDLACECSRAPLGRAVSQLARDDDACEHIRLAHVGDALGHPSLWLSHKLRQDARIEQIESRHVRARPALPPAVESAAPSRRAA